MALITVFELNSPPVFLNFSVLIHVNVHFFLILFLLFKVPEFALGFDNALKLKMIVFTLHHPIYIWTLIFSFMQNALTNPCKCGLGNKHS